MKQVVMYEAEDGKFFRTEKECAKHERYLSYRNDISKLYEKFKTKKNERYNEIFEEETNFVAEVAKAFDFEIKKTELGLDFINYSFVPKASCKDAELKMQAWENFDIEHILPF